MPLSSVLERPPYTASVPQIEMIGVEAWHGTPPTPYVFPNRSAAAAGCMATINHPRLCNKAELYGFSMCATGWCADW
eukprot:COSAG05_NODE_753_length_7528_cov_4.065823_7_plen_77_part_00